MNITMVANKDKDQTDIKINRKITKIIIMAIIIRIKDNYCLVFDQSNKTRIKSI